MASGVETAMALSYPIFDIAIVVGLMIMVIRRSYYHFDIRLPALVLGMSIQVISDFIYLTSGDARSGHRPGRSSVQSPNHMAAQPTPGNPRGSEGPVSL